MNFLCQFTLWIACAMNLKFINLQIVIVVTLVLVNLGVALIRVLSSRIKQAISQGTSSWSLNLLNSLVWFWPTQHSPLKHLQSTVDWLSPSLTSKKVCSMYVNCTTWAQAAFNKSTMWSTAPIRHWLWQASQSLLQRVAWHRLRLQQLLLPCLFTNPRSIMTNGSPAAFVATWSPWTAQLVTKPPNEMHYLMAWSLNMVRLINWRTL